MSQPFGAMRRQRAFPVKRRLDQEHLDQRVSTRASLQRVSRRGPLGSAAPSSRRAGVSAAPRGGSTAGTCARSACRAARPNPYCSDGPGLPLFRPHPRSPAGRGGAAGRQQARLRACRAARRPGEFRAPKGRGRGGGVLALLPRSCASLQRDLQLLRRACPTMPSWPSRRARRRATGRPGRWGSIRGRSAGARSGRRRRRPDRGRHFRHVRRRPWLPPAARRPPSRRPAA